VAGGVAGWAAAQPAPDDAITDPVWRSQATGQQMSAVYPMRAMRSEKIGVAVVRCVAGAYGRLEACAVVCEGPKDWGFGAAALKTTRYFRMAPEDKAGRAVAGRAVKLPFHFNPPGFKPYDRCEPVGGVAG
jgi:protein TonB